MPRTRKPLEVHMWDDISGQVTKHYPDVAADAPHDEVLKATYEFIDYEPNEGERWNSADLPELRMIIGKDEYGHKFALWWGPMAKTFTDAAFPVQSAR
jgi:hypothetical protein